MIIKNNLPVYDICWLNHSVGGGIIGTFYEPESKEELSELCRNLYKENKQFDLVGHTSNIYFLPNYSVDIMISTRKVRNIEVREDCIVADCGVSVSKLSRHMINEGVKGFEGLIDLPGTVAASVYGNASCYGCSINQLLESFEILRPDGEILSLSPEKLKMKKRSTSLKRGELEGVILSVRLRKIIGEKAAIMELAEKFHQVRKKNQPGPKDNIGSIYSNTQKWTVRGMIFYIVAKAISILLRPIKHIDTIQIILYMMGCEILIPYVWGWNRFIWKDAESHELFWKFHHIHTKLFVNSDFEIIIKGNHVY